MTAPQVVTITWQGDPDAATLQTFDDWLLGSDFWLDRVSEYGIGKGKQLATYEIPEAAPSALGLSDLAGLVSDGIQSGVLPKSSSNTLYVFYTPDGTTVNGSRSDGPGCGSWGGLHWWTRSLILAVIPRCASANLAQIDFLTGVASHEFFEAATDPSGEGWLQPDRDARATESGELADLCETNAFVRVNGYAVALLYSNAAAAKNTRPCQPTAPGPVAVAVPNPPQIDVSSGGSETASIEIHATDKNQVKVQVYCDDPNVIPSVSEFSGVDGDAFELGVMLTGDESVGTDIPIVLRAETSDGYAYASDLVIHVP